jgi:hypothetical protein
MTFKYTAAFSNAMSYAGAPIQIPYPCGNASKNRIGGPHQSPPPRPRRFAASKRLELPTCPGIHARL